MQEKTMKLPLWNHQQAGLDRVRKLRYALWDMEMGTGKSRGIVEIVDLLKNPNACVLICCPKSVRDFVWPSEFERWSAFRYPVLALSKGTSAKKAEWTREFLRRPGKRVVVVNYETMMTPNMMQVFMEWMWDMIVADESHRVKSAKGKQSKQLARLTMLAGLRVCLSGTPLPHSPLDIFGQARFLDPSIFGSSWSSFKAKYAIVGVAAPKGLPQAQRAKIEALPVQQRAHAVQLLRTQSFKSDFRRAMRENLERWLRGGPPLTPNMWNALGTIDWRKLQEVVGYKNTAELEAKMARFTVQARARDVLELPEQRHVKRFVQFESSERKQYDELSKEFVTWLENGGAVTADSVLVRLLRLQQVTSGFLPDEENGGRETVVNSAKEQMLTEDLEDLDPHEKIVVFGTFTYDIRTVARAAKATGRECFELSGRKKELEEWRAAPPGSVIAVQIQAGGVGISLVDARICCYLSGTFNLGNYLQSLARVHRPGQEREVVYYHYIVKGTVDETIHAALSKRKNLIDEVLEGVRRRQEGSKHAESDQEREGSRVGVEEPAAQVASGQWDDVG